MDFIESQHFDFTPYQVAICEVLDKLSLSPHLEEDYIVGMETCNQFNIDVIFRHMISHTGISAAAIQRHMDTYLSTYVQKREYPPNNEFTTELLFSIRREIAQKSLLQETIPTNEMRDLIETGSTQSTHFELDCLNWGMPDLYMKTYLQQPIGSAISYIHGGEISSEGTPWYIFGYARAPIYDKVEIVRVKNPIYTALQEIETGNIAEGKQILQNYAIPMLNQLIGKDLPEEKAFLAYLLWKFDIQVPDLPPTISMLRSFMKQCAESYIQKEDYTSAQKVYEGIEKLDAFRTNQKEKLYDKAFYKADHANIMPRLPNQSSRDNNHL